MKIEELLNQELYFIKSNVTGVPYLINFDFFILFTNKAFALDFAQRISKRLEFVYSIEGPPVSACAITDNDSFFYELKSLGFNKFSFDKEETIFSLNSIYTRKSKTDFEEKEFYSYYLKHIKMQKLSHIGQKTLKEIEKGKQYLRIGKHPEWIQHFIESQQKLNLYCQDIPLDDINVSLKPQETFTPTINQSVESAEIIAQDRSEISFAENNNIAQQQEKTRRPFVAVIMFVLSGLFALACIGSKIDGDLSDIVVFGVAAVSYFVLGIAMLNMYLKRFGYAIIAVFSLILTIDSIFFDKEDISTVILSLIITVFLGGLFAFVNRNKHRR